MTYRITEEEIQEQWADFRSDYPPFVAYQFSEWEMAKLSAAVVNVLKTQNGQDFDDYCITDEDDKVGKYLKNVNAQEYPTALIHGVGTGREVLVAKEMGFRAYGTTLGSRNIEFANRYLNLNESEIRECLVDVLPFRSSVFDVVIGVQLFEHVVSPLPFLLEQSRVLRKGGKLILEWPPASTHTMDDNPHHQVCFVPGQAHGLFRKAGFDNIKVYYSNMQPVPEELWWSGEAVPGPNGKDLMLCIEGTKADSDQQYINSARYVL